MNLCPNGIPLYRNERPLGLATESVQVAGRLEMKVWVMTDGKPSSPGPALLVRGGLVRRRRARSASALRSLRMSAEAPHGRLRFVFDSKQREGRPGVPLPSRPRRRRIMRLTFLATAAAGMFAPSFSPPPPPPDYDQNQQCRHGVR